MGRVKKAAKKVGKAVVNSFTDIQVRTPHPNPKPGKMQKKGWGPMVKGPTGMSRLANRTTKSKTIPGWDDASKATRAGKKPMTAAQRKKAIANNRKRTKK